VASLPQGGEMSERLLTDEEIAEAVGHSVLYLRLPVNNMRFADLKVVANAEHKATLKAVGEWLDKEIDREVTVSPSLEMGITSLKRGEMSEEGK